MLELCMSRHADYCARHRITYWPTFGDVQAERSPHWNKILLIQHAFSLGFETIVWLDADTIIMRDDADIRTVLNGGPPLALAQHPGPGLEGSDSQTHWNSGVMILRNTPRMSEFFDEVWRAGPMANRHYWNDQARILDVLPRFPGILQRLDDRWNSTVGVNETPNAVIKAWHGWGPRALLAMYNELKIVGAHRHSDGPACKIVHADNAAERAARFIETIPAYPNSFEGRGIVICGGGLGYFSCAWVCIHQLRRLGCKLPIQLWYLGQREFNEQMRAIVMPLGVECIDGYEIQQRHPARILNGWELKPYALLHCPFREVLLLDADNVPAVNPEFLFDTKEFRATGAIFWPDYGRMKPERLAWTVFDVPYRDEPEFESGQIVLDKRKCWRPLNLTMWYNEHSDFFYDHVHGDKDTFRFAWHRLNEKFSMPPFPIEAIEGTMCQHDFTGRRIFQHRNTDKWNFYKGNKSVPGFLFEQECLADLRRLQEIWDGNIGAGVREPAGG